MNREAAEPHVQELPGTRARKWVDRQRDVAAPSTDVYDFVWDPTEPAEGPFCTDADGNVLLDFTSHVGAAPLGYNNPKIREPMATFEFVDPLKIAGQDFYVGPGSADDPDFPGPARLMERLTDVTDQYGMDTVFLSNSGAEAVENAIKICYDGGGSYGITFEGAFHGRTLGALSLNRSKSVYRRDFPEVAGVHDAPFCRDRRCRADTCSCGFFAGETSQLRRMLSAEGSVAPEEVAYLILEPIQGEGGYYPPSEAFASEVADVCAEHDITIVADEIQSGMGRTGEWWAADHYPIEPDVITAAKGLRVGATISRAEVFPEEEGRISSTWGAGDIVASLQGALTIDTIREHDLLSNATARGRRFKEHLRDAALESVVDVRGKGLMLGVEFSSQNRREDVLERAFKRGLLTLACGQKTLRILPPLDVTEREIDLGAGLLIEAIE